MTQPRGAPSSSPAGAWSPSPPSPPESGWPFPSPRGDAGSWPSPPPACSGGASAASDHGPVCRRTSGRPRLLRARADVGPCFHPARSHHPDGGRSRVHRCGLPGRTRVANRARALAFPAAPHLGRGLEDVLAVRRAAHRRVFLGQAGGPLLGGRPPGRSARPRPPRLPRGGVGWGHWPRPRPRRCATDGEPIDSPGVDPETPGPDRRGPGPGAGAEAVSPTWCQGAVAGCGPRLWSGSIAILVVMVGGSRRPCP